MKNLLQDVQPSSAVVSWQGRNASSMHGYMIAYHALNHNNQIKKTRQLPASSRAYRLPDLQSDTPYLVCVLGLASGDESADFTSSALSTRSADTLRNSPYSKCAEVGNFLFVFSSLKFETWRYILTVMIPGIRYESYGKWNTGKRQHRLDIARVSNQVEELLIRLGR